MHPYRVHLRAGGWYLRARESGGSDVKTFRVDRMRRPRLAQPGTAEVPPPDSHPSVDPVAWQVDPPLVATLATTAEHVPQVRALLGGGTVVDRRGGGLTDGTGAPAELLLEVPVTNRSAFRGRLFELGSRVRLLGPEELREDVRAHLLAVLGAAAMAGPAGRGVARYARRIAHVPGALRVLRLHPEGLPIAAVAEELERGGGARCARSSRSSSWPTWSDSGAVGLRSCALEFLAVGEDGVLAEADLTSAQVVRLTDDSPFEELGVAFLSAADLAVLYRAAAELAALEPENEVLAAAVERLGATVLGGVEGRGGAFADVAADLRRAAAGRRRVRLRYARAWQPGVVERVVEPWRVVSTRRGYEVDAGPLDERGELRTYLVSGVREHEVLDETFDRPADADDRIAATRRPAPVRVVVPADKVWVVERFVESVEVEQQDEDGAQLLLQVLPPVRERVGLLLAVAGPEAFVVSPADLADADAETARRLLDHHGLG